MGVLGVFLEIEITHGYTKTNISSLCDFSPISNELTSSTKHSLGATASPREKGLEKGVSGRRKTKPETRGEDRSEQRRVQGNRGSAVAAVGQYRLYTT